MTQQGTGKYGRSVNVNGVSGIESKLLNLVANLNTGVLRKAAVAAGEVVRDGARERLPAELEAEYIVSEITLEEPGKIIVGVGADKEHWYYRFLEYGAKQHTIKAKNGKEFIHPGVTAKRFLRDSMDDNEDKVRNTVAAKIEAELGVSI